MNALRHGDTTTKDNLNVFVYERSSDRLKDPYSITFDLYDVTSGSPVIIGGPDRLPIKFAVGSYFAPWQIPEDENIGRHKIVWKIKENATSTITMHTEEFDIVSRLTLVNEEYPEQIKRLIYKLRTKLRDVNPDRDYHFAPPSSEQQISGFTETRGYKWPDEQLVNHIEDATNYVNLFPPATTYDIMTYPAAWEPLMLLEAQVYALYDLAILWAGEEFNYSLAGISLDIRRSDKYSGFANQIQSMVDKQLEMAKKRVLCTVGLRQDRYTYSRGASMGPWCCAETMLVHDTDNNELVMLKNAYDKKIKHSYSMNLDTNEIIVNDVKAIWSNGKQDVYKLVARDLFSKYEIQCTNTHRFFDKDNKEVQLKDLTVNQKVWVKKGKKSKLVKVKSIEFVGSVDTYDMEMKEPFRNYVANGFVVHNTSGQNIKRWTGSRFNRIQIG